MNIFVLDLDPKICAQFHVDRHVVKLILESGQLLSNAHYFVGGEGVCKPAYQNHPCAKWTRESLANYKWLSALGLELLAEYTHRYGKIHKWEHNPEESSPKLRRKMEWLNQNCPDLPQIGLTPFAQAMPDYCKVPGKAVAAYRNYYIYEKNHLAEWKNRDVPEWYKKG